MPIILQDSFLGSGPVVSGNIRDRMRYILSEYPKARDDYRLALYLYWREFEGLGELLGDKADAFRQWFVNSATSPKTLQNRTMEVQNRNPELEASPDIAQERQRQAKAGPVL
jgi:hypothetical protein